MAGLTFLFGSALAGELQLTVSDDRLAVRADSVSLRSVLEELSRQTGLIVSSQEALDEPVSIELESSTLPELVRNLLRQKSFMLHQPESAPVAATPLAHIRLWIFSVDEGTGGSAWTTHPGLPADHTGEGELLEYQMLSLSEDPRDREEAMFGFADVGVDAGRAYLEQGLTDPEKRIREAAIVSLAAVGGRESARVLGLALGDPDPRLRMQAVDALGEVGGPEAIELLERALSDDDHRVREAAAEWLTELAWYRD